MTITIKVPATSANLGPGFDALGLALDLWNETTFELADDFSVYIEGEGKGRLAQGRHNMVLRAAHKLAEHTGKKLPPCIVRCFNRIPTGSGLGSSAAATLTGLLAANVLTEAKLSKDEILSFASKLEGHPDNVAPALMGGLVVSTMDDGKVIARSIPIELDAYITIVLPDFRLSTKDARAALPKKVLVKDAVHNISHAILVTEAFRNNDFDLLGEVMTDALHQPYRLKLIPGAEAAIEAAKQAGASAIALSGAGPSLIVFSKAVESFGKKMKNVIDAKGYQMSVHGVTEGLIGTAMQRAFKKAGIKSRVFHLWMSNRGAEILDMEHTDKTDSP